VLCPILVAQIGSGHSFAAARLDVISPEPPPFLLVISPDSRGRMIDLADSMARSTRTPLTVAGHPVYSALLPVPIVCFLGALLTDIAYVGAPDMLWLDFSSWLLFAGLVAGGFAGALLIVELVRAGSGRRGALTLHFVLLLAAWITEIFNSLIHARDGWTAVAGTGITLSAIAAVLALAAGWFWQSARRALSGETR